MQREIIECGFCNDRGILSWAQQDGSMQDDPCLYCQSDETECNDNQNTIEDFK